MGFNNNAEGSKFMLTIGKSQPFYCDSEIELALTELARYGREQFSCDHPVHVSVHPQQ